MRCSGDPRLFTASIAYSVLFPCALTVFASAAQRHRCHLFAAVWAIIRDTSCIDALPTPVFCKRHPHSTAGTLRRVRFIYFPLSHCQPSCSTSRLLFSSNQALFQRLLFGIRISHIQQSQSGNILASLFCLSLLYVLYPRRTGTVLGQPSFIASNAFSFRRHCQRHPVGDL